jgi:hypothetical protein
MLAQDTISTLARRLHEARMARPQPRHFSPQYRALVNGGIAMPGRFFGQQVATVRQGGDTAGACFDPAAPPVGFDAADFPDVR